ncbi:hypothetical protein R5R35_006223 [Gryllus longicercus]|uniref:C-type lectin domain-containing protein n=1 Tax=Gryllus longicercus TaxID=2509291 RepID=A0AAN9W8Y7_9ORTH
MRLKWESFAQLLSASVVVMSVGAVIGEECTAEGPRLLVSSSRNATGHWTVAIALQRQHAAPRPGNPDALQLEVQPTTTRCNGARTHALNVALQGQPLVGLGYEQVEGFGFYKVHRKAVIWESAREVCEKEGSHLVILNSEGEAAAITRLMKRHKVTDTNVFAGFHDKAEEGNHITVFGDDLENTGFTQWNPGQPDNRGNEEDCGAINSSTGKLNDVSCTKLASSYICEHIVI